MTITLPGRIEAALNAEAAQWDLSGPEFLKNLLFTACQSKDGVVLKLTMPPVGPDPAQTELLLGGGKPAGE